MKTLSGLFLGLATVVMLGQNVQAADGKDLYDKKCAKCHGIEGDGQGRAGRSLKSRPTAFNDKAVMAKVTDDELFKATKEGGEAVKQSKEMEAYSGFSDDEIKALVVYMRSLSK